jgi:hypothetical protein
MAKHFELRKGINPQNQANTLFAHGLDNITTNLYKFVTASKFNLNLPIP